MLLRKPAYFDAFSCIASACPDSCCKEWAVQVDDISASLYRGLPGPLGDRLRQVLIQEDGDTVLAIEDGRCPMWRDDGLCRIQAELGESALCDTCRDFPRLRHDYGDFLELGLELSCPEAARLILSAPFAPPVTQAVPGGEEPAYDGEAMALLLATRETALELLADENYTVPEVLALVLLYGYRVQEALDGGELPAFQPQAALESAREFAKPGEFEDVLRVYRGLEILTDGWLQRLETCAPGPWQREHRALARYFVERYWLQAVSDYDLAGRVKFAIVSCLVIRALGGGVLETAQRYSKEIENNLDNVETLLDAAYREPAFTDEKILGWLLA